MWPIRYVWRGGGGSGGSLILVSALGYYDGCLVAARCVCLLCVQCAASERPPGGAVRAWVRGRVRRGVGVPAGLPPYHHRVLTIVRCTCFVDVSERSTSGCVLELVIVKSMEQKRELGKM